MATLPKASTPLVQVNGLMAPEWYRLFQSAFGEVTDLTGAQGTANTMPGNNTGAAAADIRLTPTQIKALLAIAAGDVSGLASVATAGTYASLTGTWTLTDSLCGVIETAANKSYIIGLKMPFAGTIIDLTTQSTSGTCTMTATVDGGAVVGISNAVSTSEVTSTATSNNGFSVGQNIALVITSNSAALNVAFNMKITRTLP